MTETKEQPRDEQERKRSRWRLNLDRIFKAFKVELRLTFLPGEPTVSVGGVVAVVIGVVVVALGSWYFFHQSQSKVKVPNLVGMPRAAAEAQLKQVGLSLHATYDEASEQPVGTVLRTDPSAGAELDHGAGVTLVLAFLRPTSLPSPGSPILPPGSNPGTNLPNPGTNLTNPGTNPTNPGTNPTNPGTNPTNPVDPHQYSTPFQLANNWTIDYQYTRYQGRGVAPDGTPPYPNQEYGLHFILDPTCHAYRATDSCSQGRWLGSSGNTLAGSLPASVDVSPDGLLFTGINLGNPEGFQDAYAQYFQGRAANDTTQPLRFTGIWTDVDGNTGTFTLVPR